VPESERAAHINGNHVLCSISIKYLSKKKTTSMITRSAWHPDTCNLVDVMKYFKIASCSFSACTQAGGVSAVLTDRAMCQAIDIDFESSTQLGDGLKSLPLPLQEHVYGGHGSCMCPGGGNLCGNQQKN
jgi:hypothetical protein